MVAPTAIMATITIITTVAHLVCQGIRVIRVIQEF